MGNVARMVLGPEVIMSLSINVSRILPVFVKRCGHVEMDADAFLELRRQARLES
jgi:hypothetical protein